MNKTFLITGAAGFIGYYLAEKLSRDHRNRVVVVDNFVRAAPDPLYLDLMKRPNVIEFRLDLSRSETFGQLPDDVDIILHMAALNGTQNFYERSFDVIRHSTLPAFHLLEKYAPRGSNCKFVYAGSSEAYAGAVTCFNWEIPTAENVPLVIEDPLNPRWSYGGSKLFGEIVTVNGCRSAGMPFLIIRYHNVFGPRMGDKHVVPDFLMRAKRGKFILYGHDDTRSFLYIDDAVNATLAAVYSQTLENSIVNVGSPDEILIADLGRMIMAECGLNGTLELKPSPPGSVKRRAPNIGRLLAHTSWRPRVPLRQGLRRAAAYYLDRPDLQN